MVSLRSLRCTEMRQVAFPDGGRKGGLWGDVPRAVGPSSHRTQDVSVAAEAYQKATSGITPLTILDYYHNAYAGVLISLVEN
jgi:hypothetical protein